MLLATSNLTCCQLHVANLGLATFNWACCQFDVASLMLPTQKLAT